MSKIDSEEAEKTLALLTEIGELQDELDAMAHSSERGEHEEGRDEVRR